MKDVVRFLFAAVFVLYLATPLITGLWMKAVWRRQPYVAFGIGVASLMVWLLSFVWLILYFRSGYWYAEHASDLENLIALQWMTGLSAIIIATNAGFIYGIKGLRRTD